MENGTNSRINGQPTIFFQSLLIQKKNQKENQKRIRIEFTFQSFEFDEFFNQFQSLEFDEFFNQFQSFEFDEFLNQFQSFEFDKFFNVPESSTNKETSLRERNKSINNG